MADVSERQVCVLFDCNNTLVHKPELPARISEFLHTSFGTTVSQVAVEAALQTMYEHRKFDHPRFASPEDRMAFYISYNQELCRLFDVVISDTDARLLNETLATVPWKLFPDVEPTLIFCKERGITLGVVANWTESLEHVLESVGILDYFDFTYSSHTLGVEKPDPAIFKTPLARIPKGSTVYYIGDDYDLDVISARGAGLTPILLDRKGVYADKQDVDRIAELAQLKDMLSRKNQ